MNYAQLLFPDFSLILCGYLVCRYTALNRPVWAQVDARLLNLYETMLVPGIDSLTHTFDRKPVEFRTSIVDTKNFDYVSRMREMT